ncbi:biopolymer transporter ExbD [Roseicyclus mahoneyensis]|uniref:Outer membrane transport energization protein ExbD n=1 Tax=Roseicyclus mahoneyensis TaxID=164332 RepID=A0A316GD76_9RHOB|nr:biopolymer transporter ExbD [Roseicyclus mahoneyensis]PWK58165.1 outer membrane transport energization protein ExbD [Roseicyclus mahoneyensis]
MSLRPTPWRRRPIALTPLIDIIFLLLLFFMLSSTFTRFAELPLSQAGVGAAEGAAPFFVQLSPQDVMLNGVAVQLDDLPSAIEALAPPEAEGAQTLLVTLAPEVTSQRLVDLLARLRGLPGLTVSVLD